MGERLLLMRHARAQWPRPGGRDFDRALAPAGVREARSMGEMMAAAGYVPDAVLCSAALRCRETWLSMADAFAPCPVEHDDNLYFDDAAGYLETIRLHEGGGALLVIGHNPMTEDLAGALAAGRGASPPEALAGGFPTCGLAVFELSGPRAALAPGTARLEAFLTPRALAD